MQQPMEQVRLPAHTAQFLLGMTDRLPPLTGREMAVAGMRSVLDNGAFAGSEAGEAGERKISSISVHSSSSAS